MGQILLDASRGARLLSGEFDYVVQSGSTIYYGDTQGVSASVNIGSVASGSTLSRRSPSWVISAGQSDIAQIDPAPSSVPSTIPTGSVETQDIQAGAVTASKLGLTKTTYTQTYSTAAATVPAATAVAVATTAATQTTPYGYAGATQADAIPVAINANAADILAVKKLVNQLIDDAQLNNAAS